ncbi:PTS system mannose-specific IID component [Geothermobacter ehrlichii]|uniref:PTS system mannose-specific IID component n=2 Tax=Geothermobacter ehrlichii TaxID=213224 RepID=A0A5D3WKH2_9BACT|nr:PTS system mannose-specific IID component [Geothermobacter ehrlichii]
MQGLGVLFVMAPAIRSLYRGEERIAVLRRFLGYFNTHPFLASPVLGGMLRFGEDGGKSRSGMAGTDFGNMLMAPYAAMGDALFWGGLRPLAAVMGLFFAVRGSFWGAAVLLVVFNLPAIYFRLVCFYRGYREGGGMVETIQRWRLPDLAIRIKEATVVLLGGLCATWMVSGLEREGAAPAWGLLALPAVCVFGWLVRIGVSPLMIIFSVVALMIPLAMFLQ